MLEISTPRKRSELNNWDTHLKLAMTGSGEKHIIEASDWPQRLCQNMCVLFREPITARAVQLQ